MDQQQRFAHIAADLNRVQKKQRQLEAGLVNERLSTIRLLGDIASQLVFLRDLIIQGECERAVFALNGTLEGLRPLVGEVRPTRTQ